MTTFVLVGHCVPDSGMLTNAITRAVPGAKVIRANDDAALDGWRRRGTVWLVNRVLDGDFLNDDGIALIEREIGGGTGDDDVPTLILISNHAEAQNAAVALGARRGFGKRAIFANETAKVLVASMQGVGQD